MRLVRPRAVRLQRAAAAGLGGAGPGGGAGAGRGVLHAAHRAAEPAGASPEMAPDRAEIDSGFGDGGEAVGAGTRRPSADRRTRAAPAMLRPNLKANDFLVAESAAMRGVIAAVERFADGGAPVLVCGEHGTGRELVARVLHQRGPRGRGRFIAVRPTFEDVPSPPPRERGRAPEGGTADPTCERAHRALRAAVGGTLLVKDVSDLSAASQRTLRRAIRDRDRASPPPGPCRRHRASASATVSGTRPRSSTSSSWPPPIWISSGRSTPRSSRASSTSCSARAASRCRRCATARMICRRCSSAGSSTTPPRSAARCPPSRAARSRGWLSTRGPATWPS